MTIKPKSIAIALGLYLASTAASFATFTYIAGPQSTPEESEKPELIVGRLTIDPSAPKDQECPLNGQMFTQVERESWEERRPLLVMIENSVDARPQSGLSKADIVYEAIAEGGVTRFMAIYYCAAQVNDVLIAPVRSARTYFLDWASEYSMYPLYAHVGGANCSADKYPNGTFGPCKTDKRAQALEQIQSYGWGGRTGNDMNQFSIGYPTFYRDYNRLDRQVATEHTMVSSTEKLWELAMQRGWTNLDLDDEDWTETYTPWDFSDELPAGERGSITSISHEFWDGYKQYGVSWEYDPGENIYKRFNGDQPHLDHNTGQQLAVKNIVIQLTNEERSVDELKHLLYQTTGRGDALVFQNGQVVEAKWSKKNRLDRTTFTDTQGNPIEFARGPIWVSVVSDDTEINY